MPAIRLTFTLLGCLSLTAVTAQTATESKILEQLERMNASLERLEERVASIETRLDQEPVPVVYKDSAGKSEGLVDQVVDAMWIREERVYYPWMDSAKWDELKEGMSADEVMAILGEPTLEDPSLHRRIDTVYTYRGRRPANGEKVIGKVRFYHGEVVDIEKP